MTLLPGMNTVRANEEAILNDTSASQGRNFPKRADRSGLVSRNITIGARRTSVRLEPDMWNALRDICRRERVTIHDIATIVAIRKPQNSSFTAAIRVFVMAYFRMAATEDGHNSAGHGPGGSFMNSLLIRKMGEHDNYEQGMNTRAR